MAMGDGYCDDDGQMSVPHHQSSDNRMTLINELIKGKTLKKI
jgi:hypothetical protein